MASLTNFTRVKCLATLRLVPVPNFTLAAGNSHCALSNGVVIRAQQSVAKSKSFESYSLSSSEKKNSGVERFWQTFWTLAYDQRMEAILIVMETL